MAQLCQCPPVEQILTVQNTIASKNIFGVAASPVIDGYVLDDIMKDNYARGKFQKVPIIVGSTTNETSVFTCSFFNGSATTAQVQASCSTLYNKTIIDAIPTIYFWGRCAVTNNTVISSTIRSIDEHHRF